MMIAAGRLPFPNGLSIRWNIRSGPFGLTRKRREIMKGVFTG